MIITHINEDRDSCKPKYYLKMGYRYIMSYSLLEPCFKHILEVIVDIRRVYHSDKTLR